MSAKIRAQLDAIEKAYWDAFGALAAQVRASHVVPYCDRRNVKFVSGMGGYTFTMADGRNLSGWDGAGEVPRYLSDALNLGCVQQSTCLGAYMDDYTPADYPA